MGFYLRCRRLQSGAAAQADSGGLLMAKISGFAKAFAGRAAHCRNGHQATLANTAEFFNSLLVAQDSHGDCEERASTRMVPIAKIRISCFVWGSSIVCPTLKGAGGSAPMAPPMEARPACECSVCRPRSRRPGSRGHLTDNPSANRQFRRLPSTCAER